MSKIDELARLVGVECEHDARRTSMRRGMDNVWTTECHICGAKRQSFGDKTGDWYHDRCDEFAALRNDFPAILDALRLAERVEQIGMHIDVDDDVEWCIAEGRRIIADLEGQPCAARAQVVDGE